MKIVFLSQRYLLPMDSGGKIRTGKILEQLVKTNEITLISNVESPKDDPYLSQIGRFCTKFIPVPWKEPKKYSILFYIRLFFKMISIYPITALNDYSIKLKKAVKKECTKKEYDLAICDFIQSALNFKDVKHIKTVLFQHNVESMIAKRHFEHSRNIITRFFWWLQWKKMFYYEKKTCRAFDTIIAVADKDKSLFNELYYLNNVETISTGVDIDYFVPQTYKGESNSLVFCGSMDWLPNEDAVIYFIKTMLPGLKNKIPRFRFILVGKNPSPSLQKITKKYPEIELTGWVQDTRPYIAESILYVVPIRIGGGTRLKIYEAMAMGKAVISTSIGAEGLPVTNGENITIEDDPVNFQDKIIRLIENEEEREKIGLAASQFVRKNFSWQKVTEKFVNICQNKSKRRLN